MSGDSGPPSPSGPLRLQTAPATSSRILRARARQTKGGGAQQAMVRQTSRKKWNCEDLPPTQILHALCTTVPFDKNGRVAPYGTSDEPCAPAGHHELTVITARRDVLPLLAARRPSFRSGCLCLRTSPVPRHASLLVRIALTPRQTEDDGGRHVPVRQTRHKTRNCAYLPRAQTRRALRTVVPFGTSPQPCRRRRAPLLPPTERLSCSRSPRLLGCLPPAILHALASCAPAVPIDLVVQGSISQTCSAPICASTEVC